MILTGRSKILDSGSFDNQVWGTLHKAWKDMSLQKIKMNMITWSGTKVSFKSPNMT